MCSCSQLTLCFALFLPFGTVSLGQEIRRTIVEPDWSAARTAMEADELGDAAGVGAFRGSDPEGVNDTALPVLVIGTGPVRAAPQFSTQTTAYSAFYPLAAAQLAIMASTGAIELTTDDVLARGLAIGSNISDPDFLPIERGADLSFTRFGIRYVLELKCDNADDSRCTEPQFLQTVYNSLILVGGSGL